MRWGNGVGSGRGRVMDDGSWVTHVVCSWGEEDAVFAAVGFHEDYCYAGGLGGDGLDRGCVDERVFEGGDEGGSESWGVLVCGIWRV